jgi:hypothetical protein
MSNEVSGLQVLSTRAGFNSAVRQIKKTMSIAEGLKGSNLGDILYELGDDEFSGEKAGMLLRMLLIDKMGYKSVSSNLETIVEKPVELAEEFAAWKGVDLIVAYHHPELGLLVANPKIAEELAGFGDMRKRELLVVYAGKLGNPADEVCQQAAELTLRLFEGKTVKAAPAMLKGNFTVRKLAKPGGEKEAAPKKAAPKKAKAASKPKVAARVAAPPVTASSAAASKMTPRYAVVVQNELFHNGNVEAWKRIIASYKAKHSTLEVYIYYEGERILDINSLFKWGKVKHGSAIEFAVAGNEIQDVAKLQRYLSQGASNQFEAFLHGQVNTVLKLF